MNPSKALSAKQSGVEQRLVLVGGFLGAGKTTLIGRMVRHLSEKSIRCGVITNDQAAGLVDSSSMQAAGAESVREVAGGCFCCRLEDLVKVLAEQTVTAKEDQDGRETQTPLVVIAEPVGSCTDLTSTVLLPLERVYQVPFQISPLSVVVDARRALASLGGRRTPGDFSKDVGYIYRKQLEEAELIVVNKADVMAPEDLADLLRRLDSEYPGKEVFVMSAKSGEGVEPWLERVLLGQAKPERLMDMDYPRYGVGEALLGWHNAEVEVGEEAGTVQDGDEWLIGLARGISLSLALESYEVAHFKMALKDEDGRLGTVNQVMSGTEPELSRIFGGPFRRGLLTVNLRAEGEPERLRAMVEEALEAWSRQTTAPHRMKESAAFRPGQPVPTARVTTL